MDPRASSALAKFHERVAARLERGAIEYGNRSMIRPAVDLIDEVQQELEDVTGWSAILWLRLEAIREKAERAEASNT